MPFCPAPSQILIIVVIKETYAGDGGERKGRGMREGKGERNKREKG